MIYIIGFEKGYGSSLRIKHLSIEEAALYRPRKHTDLSNVC